MKNLTWKGNEWQGLLFVYACFLMLLGWLAKLRSRFHPKKFLIKCWCACLRLVLRSAWNDFGLRSQLLFSWFKCRPTDARTYRTPPCTPNNYLLAELGLLNLGQKVEVIWISARPRIAFGWQKSERLRRRSMTITEFNSLTFAISREIFFYFLT